MFRNRIINPITNMLENNIINYNLMHQPDPLSAHMYCDKYVDAKYVELMKKYILQKCKFGNEYSINVFRGQKIHLINSNCQTYLLIGYYDEEMFVFELEYDNINKIIDKYGSNINIGDECWNELLNYRVFLVLF